MALPFSYTIRYTTKGGVTVAAIYGADEAELIAHGKDSARMLASMPHVSGVSLKRGDKAAIEWMMDGGKVVWGKLDGGKEVSLH